MKNSDESNLCIVGNIIDKHYYGEQKEIRRGTKHFSPNSKIYCLPEYGGMGHETMVVLGMHRKSKKLIKISIPSKHIKTYRLKTIYKPFIKNHVKENLFYKTWNERYPEEKDCIQFINYLNSLTEEIE